MTVHIYTAPGQPLTRYVDHNLPGRSRVYRTPPRSVWQCRKCGARRWAKNLRVQVYYDAFIVFCAGGCRRG